MILFAGSFPPPSAGGSVEYVYNIVSALPPGTVTVHTAATPGARTVDEGLGQTVVRHRWFLHVLGVVDPGGTSIRARLRQLVSAPIAALWIVARDRPDIVHLGEFNWTGIGVLLASRLFGIPYIMYSYAEEIPIFSRRRRTNFVYRRVLRGAAAVTTVSEYTRGLLRAHGVPDDRIVKILPAVRSAKRLPASSEVIAAMRTAFGLADRRILLTVGALTERKGHATVIEALSRMIGAAPDLVYVIAGVGPREAALRALASDLGVEANVRFVGRVDDATLAALYDASSVFVMPHRQVATTLDTEGCPTVFLEAAAHGVASVGGNAGGVRDAIVNGETGFIVEGTDAEAVQGALERLLADGALRERIGAAGRRFAAGLTPERNAERVLALSEQVIQAHGRRRL